MHAFLIVVAIAILIVLAGYFVHRHFQAQVAPYVVDAENDAAKVEAYTAAALKTSEAKGREFVTAVETDAAILKSKL
jgi:type IV secretory pathway TrbF-like protein